MKYFIAFFLAFFLLLPSGSFAREVEFLNPVVKKVTKQKFCFSDEECRAIFLIQGKNFVNTNDQGSVYIGNSWAKVLRWTDNFIVATTDMTFYDRAPVVVVDTNVNEPVLITSDLLLNNLFRDSVRTAVDAIRVDKDGNRYFVAGDYYDDPARVYYRDSYWHAGLVLFIEPSTVKDQILLLARGIEENGSVPSATSVVEGGIKLPLWTDHHDSGPYFIMHVYDYIRYTGDDSILKYKVNDRTIMEHMQKIVSYLMTQDTNGNLLPEKPADSLHDWLDTIPRGGEVFYNQVLYYRALKNLSELYEYSGYTTESFTYNWIAELVKHQINKQFWNDRTGQYYERCENGICIQRLTNESSLALLYNVVEEKNVDRFMKSLRFLETPNNSAQPYGDWGVMNAFPLYDHGTPYHYQNGADWPFLDGMNAGARLKYGNEFWYYPLTRWYSYVLEDDAVDTSLPEFNSPVDKDPGLNQAWSVNPAVSLIRYGLGIDPNLDGEYKLKNPDWGRTELLNVLIRGERRLIQK